jgi:hypothetical protein
MVDGGIGEEKWRFQDTNGWGVESRQACCVSMYKMRNTASSRGTERNCKEEKGER